MLSWLWVWLDAVFDWGQMLLDVAIKAVCRVKANERMVLTDGVESSTACYRDLNSNPHSLCKLDAKSG